MTEMNDSSFTIVGVGASAGGLEAYEDFFSQMPANPGCAFVLIMHLDPNHKSMLPDLLGKITGMEVVHVTDGMAVLPNRIHVIPPNHSLFIEGEKLSLKDPARARGMRRPIDDFFRSLAEEKGDDAVGIIFSGTGCDGVQGLREIKFSGGIAMVQEPATAKYDSMPASALSAGVVDISLPPGELAGRLMDILVKRGEAKRQISEENETVKDDLELLLDEVHGQTGRDLTSYKRSTLTRRVEKRMLLKEQASIKGYRELLTKDSGEVSNLLKELLIGVTSFFRDEEMFRIIENEVLPELFKQKKKDDLIRVWVPGCATGEEAYSLAMVITAYMEDHKARRKVQIFATDLDEEAIDSARSGRFPKTALGDVPEKYRERFFREQNGNDVVSSQIREMVVFAPHDLITNPPFFKLDIVSCRNLLIYLTSAVQKKIIPLFFHSLLPGGYLVLGPSESLGKHSDLFETIDGRWKLFQRRDMPAAPVSVPLTTRSAWKGAKGHGESAERQTGFAEYLFDEMLGIYNMSGVLLNKHDEVLQVLGDVHDFLGLPKGKLSNDIYKLARGQALLHLRTAIHKARKSNERVVFKGIQAKKDDQDTYDLIVECLDKNDPDNSRLIVSFRKLGRTQEAVKSTVPSEVIRDQLVQQLQEELKITNDKLLAMTENTETAGEELKSSNEELMSMNEELQSTNEELETSQEELQALNEELSTVNSELHAKITELDQSNNDLEHLLRSTNIATVFIDRDFIIRQFTPAASEIFNLVETDVGRPLQHFSPQIEGHEAVEDAKEVLRTLETVNKELQTKDGKWFWLRMLPYRTFEDSVEGVVLTYIDITERKQMEDDLRLSRERFAMALEASQAGIYEQNVPDDSTSYYSDRWNELIGYGKSELPTDGILHEWLKEQIHEDDKELFEKGYEQFISGDSEALDVVFRIRTKSNGYVWLRNMAKAMTRDKSGKVLRLVGLIVDVHEEKTRESILESEVETRTREIWEKSRLLKRILEVLPVGVFIANDEGDIQLFNDAAEQLWEIDKSTDGKHLDQFKGWWETSGERLRKNDWPIYRAFKGETLLDEVLEIQTKLGDTKYIRTSALPVLDEDNNIVSAVSVSLDITDERVALKEAEENQRLLLAMMDCIPEGITIADAPDATIRMVSQYGLSLIEKGYDEVGDIPYELHGKTWNVYYPDGETPVPSEDLPLTRAVLRGETTKNLELQLATSSGKLLPVLCNAGPIKNKNGAITGGLIAWRDISEIKKYQSELIVATERAEAANKAKSVFLSNMSHELRTPLNGIIGMLQLIEKSLDEKDAICEYLDLARQSSNTLLGIISDVLDLAKIDAGKVEMTSVDFSFHDDFNSCIGPLQFQAMEKGVKLEYHVDDDVPKNLYGDKGHITQILFNLVGNAVKFTDQGSVQVRVALSEEQPEDARRLVRISVADTGIGIPKTQQEAIFGSFEQAQGDKQVRGGTGLGLAIVSKLADMLGGTIDLQSETGKGSTFTVTLPVEIKAETAEKPVVISGFKKTDKPLRLLVAEDDLVNQMFIREILIEIGHMPTIVSDGQQALEALGSESYDVVLMDIMMPGMNGDEAVARIRKSPPEGVDRNIPVLAMTACALQSEIDEYMQSGFNDYLTKPIMVDKLAEKLEEIMESVKEQ